MGVHRETLNLREFRSYTRRSGAQVNIHSIEDRGLYKMKTRSRDHEAELCVSKALGDVE